MRRNQVYVWMFGGENPEDLICKCLADHVNTCEIEDHFRKLIDSYQNALSL